MDLSLLLTACGVLVVPCLAVCIVVVLVVFIGRSDKRRLSQRWVEFARRAVL
ncbi:MAG: hypothetical protein JXB15_04815 [Anaerolineales bacterium]|nr:hypothetical protein [Anaerolineales bacterium]